MVDVFTIGYQKREIDDLLQALEAAGVRQLIDTRHNNSRSRKKGMAGKKLAENLKNVDIEYDWDIDFGSPDEIQKEFGLSGCLPPRRKADLRSWQARYESWLDENLHILRKLHNKIKEGGACLLCYERDHEDCHRGVLVDKLALLYPVNIIHLK